MTVPQRLSFSAQLTNCNVGPCWHIDLNVLGLLLSISIHFRKSFSCCMRFFQKMTLGLALGEFCYFCLFSWEIKLVLNTDVNDWKLMSFYWALSAFQSAFIWAISFSGSMKFFQLKITLGLALCESWPLLSEPQKNTDVYKGLLPWEGFPKQTCINHIPRKQGCKLVDQI